MRPKIAGSLFRGPARNGKIGCVRSNAGTCDFSSTHSTMAFSGGFRYTPTMSGALSTGHGSANNLNVSPGRSCDTKLCQMRTPALWLSQTF